MVKLFIYKGGVGDGKHTKFDGVISNFKEFFALPEQHACAMRKKSIKNMNNLVLKIFTPRIGRNKTPMMTRDAHSSTLASAHSERLVDMHAEGFTSNPG